MMERFEKALDERPLGWDDRYSVQTYHMLNGRVREYAVMDHRTGDWMENDKDLIALYWTKEDAEQALEDGLLH